MVVPSMFHRFAPYVIYLYNAAGREFMKLITWNVNGLRAVEAKGGLAELVLLEDPDILCLQETKAHPAQLEEKWVRPQGRWAYFSSAERAGYSGVVTYSKTPADEVQFGLGVPEFDVEGRYIITEFEEFTLYNIYFPNGSSSPERHQFKQRFLKHLSEHLKPLIAEGRKIVVVGDYNVAPSEIDVYDPVGLSHVSGFLPEERQWFQNFLALGMVDVFRSFYPDLTQKYTWWSYRDKARSLNRGWRIDLVCVTQNLLSKVKSIQILDEHMGSDHCPVKVEFIF
jgi:exodeoxyribonuclease-3